MKTKNLLFGTALAMLALSACSDDKNNVPDIDTSQHAKITINIMTNSLSRAAENPEYVDGTGDENDIKSAVIVFYDAKKNPLTVVSVSSSDLTGSGKEDPNVELVKKLEVDVPLSTGQYPSWMMFYANPIDADDVDFALTPSSISQVKRESFWGAGNTFAMNNSVYFNDNGVLQREVPVSQENFYKDDTDKATAKEVKVYLERVAGKVTLQGKTASDQIGTQEGEIEGKKLVFTPISWGVNAVPKEFYLIKRFSYTNESATLNWLTSNFSTFTVNDANNHRSYWAVSPHYAFPLIEGGKIDVSKYPYVTDDIENDNWLKYFSWNQFTGNVDVNNNTSRKVEIGESTYTMENTVHSTMYNTQNADINKNAALVSAVVVGKYTVDGEEVDFYIHSGNFYLKDDYIKTMVKLSDLIVHLDGTPLKDTDNLDEMFSIIHPTDNSGGVNAKYVEENKVTIALKKSQIGKLKYKVDAANTAEISEDNIDKINSDLRAVCGLANAYTKGMAYFNVPIRHLGIKASDAEAWPAGSFGVVRNHSYVITVTGYEKLTATTLGNGVFSPDKPIVPPSDPTDKFGLKAEIKVLSWRVVKQDVTLGKK